jgi:predicted amidohydrolase YtcJ
MGLRGTGSLVPGNHADMVQLSMDIFRGKKNGGKKTRGGDVLLNAKVVRTYVCGEPVYERLPVQSGS